MREDVPWTEVRLVVADVEGNGRRPPRLVEAAVVPIVAGSIGEPVTWLIRPPEPITWQASQIHRITNAEVAELPGVAAVAADIRAHLDGAVVVAHNAHIDLDVLTRELPAQARPYPTARSTQLQARCSGRRVRPRPESTRRASSAPRRL
jgi:DNA polymerase III epsilon subunit-like protein